MPPRWAPRAYRSCGASLMRRPGIRNERGTQVGARRKMPCPASRVCRTSVASLTWGVGVGFVLVGALVAGALLAGALPAGALLVATGAELFFAISGGLPR